MAKKVNLASLKTVIASGANGRRFTDEENTLICKMVNDAVANRTTVSVAQVRTAVGELNTKNGDEARTRAAVANAIERLGKAKLLDKSGIANESNGRTQYTEEENQVLVDTIKDAAKAKKQITLPELHAALKASGKSPKERTLPSVRAHVTNLLKEEETEGDSASA